MLFDIAERVLNRWIAASTPARKKIERLSGKTLAVVIEGVSRRVLIRFAGPRVEIKADRDTDANVEVRGAPLDLVQLAARGSLSRLKRTNVQISGEIGVAEELGEALRLARPDLEEELSGWIGDMPGHALGEALASLGRLGNKAHRSFEANLSEYLREELRVLPDARQCAAHFRQVETLRDDVERSARRIERLSRAVRE